MIPADLLQPFIDHFVEAYSPPALVVDPDYKRREREAKREKNLAVMPRSCIRGFQNTLLYVLSPLSHDDCSLETKSEILKDIMDVPDRYLRCGKERLSSGEKVELINRRLTSGQPLKMTKAEPPEEPEQSPYQRRLNTVAAKLRTCGNRAIGRIARGLKRARITCNLTSSDKVDLLRDLHPTRDQPAPSPSVEEPTARSAPVP